MLGGLKLRFQTLNPAVASAAPSEIPNGVLGKTTFPNESANVLTGDKA